MKVKLIVTAAWVLASAVTTHAHAADAVVTSPDGRVGIRIAADGASFSVMRRGETLIATSKLGLDLDGVPALGALVLESRKDVLVDNQIALIATKAANARDHYRGSTLAFREATDG